MPADTIDSVDPEDDLIYYPMLPDGFKSTVVELTFVSDITGQDAHNDLPPPPSAIEDNTVLLQKILECLQKDYDNRWRKSEEKTQALKQARNIREKLMALSVELKNAGVTGPAAEVERIANKYATDIKEILN